MSVRLLQWCCSNGCINSLGLGSAGFCCALFDKCIDLVLDRALAAANEANFCRRAVRNLAIGMASYGARPPRVSAAPLLDIRWGVLGRAVLAAPNKPNSHTNRRKTNEATDG